MDTGRAPQKGIRIICARVPLDILAWIVKIPATISDALLQPFRIHATVVILLQLKHTSATLVVVAPISQLVANRTRFRPTCVVSKIAPAIGARQSSVPTHLPIATSQGTAIALHWNAMTLLRGKMARRATAFRLAPATMEYVGQLPIRLFIPPLPRVRHPRLDLPPVRVQHQPSFQVRLLLCDLQLPSLMPLLPPWLLVRRLR